MLERMTRTLLALATVAALALATDAAPGDAPTRITIWAPRPAEVLDALGGATYGGPTGAMISERREVELAGGELRISGVAATVDPASVQLRDLTEPAVAITEQRFVPGAATPTELLARHVGEAITLVTAKGEVAGVLRAADEQTLVVELGTGDQRRLSVLRRDYVQDVRLPAGGADRPSLVWRVAAKKPGKHAVELAYRASGLSWSADYLAVLDDAGRTADFSAWATIKNATGATFERAELTLVVGGGATPGPAIAALAAGSVAKPAPGALRFVVPNPVRLGAGDAVQVELVPAHTATKAQPVVAYEAMEDPSAGYQEFPGADCTENSANSGGTSELALEVTVPSRQTLPEGRVRRFRRQGDRLELISEDQLKSSTGVARIKLSGDTEITGERKAVSCNVDERTKKIHEKVSIRIDNKGKQAMEVTIREYMWRWPVWRLEAEDRKGTLTAPQTQEYRVRVPANGSQTVTYAVVYSW